MDRRFLSVLAMSIVLALVVSAVFYQISMRGAHSKTKQTQFRDLVITPAPLNAPGSKSGTAPAS